MAAVQPDEVPILVVVNGIGSTSSSETESQPPIPATSPNSENNNPMQAITQELKELNRKMDKMITMNNRLLCVQMGVFSFMVATLPMVRRSSHSTPILRPCTLDPSNPERFLVCQNLKEPVNPYIVQHLDNLLKYEKIENVLEVVPLKYLLESQFQQYMADENQGLVQREIQALNKRLWFINHENRQQIDLRIKENDWNEAHKRVTVSRRPKPLPVEPDSGITLPVGWIKQWSKREDRFYYFNTNTNESRWEPPV